MRAKREQSGLGSFVSYWERSDATIGAPGIATNATSCPFNEPDATADVNWMLAGRAGGWEVLLNSDDGRYGGRGGGPGNSAWIWTGWGVGGGGTPWGR